MRAASIVCVRRFSACAVDRAAGHIQRTGLLIDTSRASDRTAGHIQLSGRHVDSDLVGR